MKPTFNFHIDIDVDLSIEEIWPDGDAPENPTVEDVKRVFYRKDKPSRYNVRRSLEDWGMLDFEECDVTISRWDPRAFAKALTSSPGGGAATKESTDTTAPLSEAGPTPEKDTP